MINDKQPANLPGDLLWGVAAIADYIGRERRSVYYLISKGVIPAKKLGAKTICARRSEIDRALTQGADRSKR
ncbi:excisionase family DNA binding protein [Bradyrhizobium diazoefficiens]